MRNFYLNTFCNKYKQDPIATLIYIVFSNLVKSIVLMRCEQEVKDYAKEYFEVETKKVWKAGKWFMEYCVIPSTNEEDILLAHKKLNEIIGEKKYLKLAKCIDDYLMESKQ